VLTFKGSSYMYVDGGQCKAWMQSLTGFTNLTYWLLGLPVYRAYFINHDMANARIGFLAQSDSSSVAISADSLLFNAGLVVATLALSASNLYLF